MIVESKKTICVWFSCGVASAVALKRTVEDFGDRYNVIAVNNPIKEEHTDNLRFKEDVEKWVGIKIIEAKCKEYPSASIMDVFDKRKYMSGIAGAPCTMLLKKQARYEFEIENKIDIHVLGFTLDEIERFKRFQKFERENTWGVLISNRLTKIDCFKIIEEAGIKIPEIYSLGFPNANCIGCVKSQSPTYWNLVREKFPEVFKQRLEQSERIGCKLVKLKGKRIHLSELPVDAKGGKIKSYECGIFCETKINPH